MREASAVILSFPEEAFVVFRLEDQNAESRPFRTAQRDAPRRLTAAGWQHLRAPGRRVGATLGETSSSRGLLRALRHGRMSQVHRIRSVDRWRRPVCHPVLTTQFSLKSRSPESTVLFRVSPQEARTWTIVTRWSSLT